MNLKKNFGFQVGNEFFDKDSTTVDRSASLAARWIGKSLGKNG
jgi:S-adenosylmethionine synthetase